MRVAFSDERVDKSPGQTLIVGVGNRLLGDEGIGPHIIDHLLKLPMPPDVSIVDCGCDLLNLVSYLDKPQKIILVDAIRAGGKPGQIHRFDFNELQGAQTKSHSAHQMKVVDVLRLLKQVCPCLADCKFILIGIEPKAIYLSTDLSKEVRDSIVDLTGLLLQETSLSREREEPSTAIKGELN